MIRRRDERLGARSSWQRRMQTLLLTALIVYMLLYIATFIPTGYVLFEPGSAEPVRPMVHAANSPTPIDGELMMTTVRVDQSVDVLEYVRALLDPKVDERDKSAVYGKDETREEYSERQHYVMLTSQATAIEAAYKALKIPYQIKTTGVHVMSTVKGMPADGVLEPGDEITAINGKKVSSFDELSGILTKLEPTAEVKVGYVREGVQKETKLKLARLDQHSKTPAANQEEKPKYGIGVSTANMTRIQPEEAKHEIKIDAGEIGGPSAGLMFALEIYQQLSGKDLTKGYRIAGTGTITAAGEVGVIGGIKQKVHASVREEAEIFFAPKDWHPTEKDAEKYDPILNYSIAKQEVKRIGTSMKVVEIETLQDALDYLEKLEPKK